jgi:hypothetical protein
MFNKQQFISPTEPFTLPHQTITIPQPNNDYIFTRNTYNPHVLSPYITKTDYNKIIDNAEKVISQSMISKRKYEEVKVPRFVYILFFTAITSFIIYMLTLYYAPRRSNGKTLYTISIIFAVIGICIAIALSVYNICRKIRSGKDLNDFVESDLNLFFGKVNESGSRNVKFQYNKYKKVIECVVYKDYNDVDGNKGNNGKRALMTETASLMGNDGKRMDKSESLKGESGSEIERDLNRDKGYDKMQGWYKNNFYNNNNSDGGKVKHE